MKKVLVVLIVLLLLLTSISVVMAGGDQNVGETGEGNTNQECGVQPGCGADEAPKPGEGPQY